MLHEGDPCSYCGTETSTTDGFGVYDGDVVCRACSRRWFDEHAYRGSRVGKWLRSLLATSSMSARLTITETETGRSGFVAVEVEPGAVRHVAHVIVQMPDAPGPCEVGRFSAWRMATAAERARPLSEAWKAKLSDAIGDEP